MTAKPDPHESKARVVLFHACFCDGHAEARQAEKLVAQALREARSSAFDECLAVLATYRASHSGSQMLANLEAAMRAAKEKRC